MRTYLLAACWWVAGGSWAVAETTEHWVGSAEITFSGTSTLHSWKGMVAANPFDAAVTRDASGNLLHLKAKVDIEAQQMDTAEAKRDENMHRVMKVNDYPLVSGTIDAPAAQIIGEGGNPLALPLKLKLLGKEQGLTGVISKWSLSGKEASFELDFQVSLKTSGIEVPATAFFIRVGDAIKVHARVKLRLS